MSDPRLVATVNDVPPSDSSTQDWVEALAEEMYGTDNVYYVPNDSGGYDVYVQ